MANLLVFPTNNQKPNAGTMFADPIFKPIKTTKRSNSPDHSLSTSIENVILEDLVRASSGLLRV